MKKNSIQHINPYYLMSHVYLKYKKMLDTIVFLISFLVYIQILNILNKFFFPLIIRKRIKFHRHMFRCYMLVTHKLLVKNCKCLLIISGLCNKKTLLIIIKLRVFNLKIPPNCAIDVE